MKQKIMLFAVMVGLMANSSLGATRIASVYIESLTSMQSQLFQAAQQFETPELGTAPMMINMMIPGASQVDKNAPIALHVFSGEGQKPAVILALKPATTPEMLLGAMLKSQGAKVPDAVDGRYVSEQGAAQLQGEYLLIAPSTEDLNLGLEVGIPSDLPEIPGMLRIDASPAKLVPLLEQFRNMAIQQMSDEPDQRQMFASVFECYRLALGQIARYQKGIGISEHGIEIRGKIVPKKGRAFSRIVPTLQAVNPAWVAEMEGENLFGVTSGAYSVPSETLEFILDMYIDLFEAMPTAPVMGFDPDLMRSMMNPYINSVGSPTFMTANLDEDSGLALLGGMRIDDASGYLEEMMELIHSEAYQKWMEHSGVKVSEPTTRDVNGKTVYRWDMNFDQEAFMAQMQQNGAPDATASDVPDFTKAMEMFMPGYDYAATDIGLAFSSADNASIEKAMKLLGATKKSSRSPILEKIGAPVRPYMVGRFNLLGMMNFASKMGLPEMPDFGKGGEGIIFASWKSGDAVEHVTLIPSEDIRAIRKAITTAKTRQPSGAPDPEDTEK